MDIYKLYRNFWDFAFENPSKIKPIHCAIFSFAIEHCNRLGWKREFGLPTSMVIEAIGVKSYSVYKTAFDELVEYGFIDVVQYSKNQYSSNIIALKENCKANDKANDKALDKALQKHVSKQCESTVSINKQIYNSTKEQTWRTDFEIYLNLVRSAFEQLVNDKNYLADISRWHPNLDLFCTLEKACKNYWATNAGWRQKKKSRSKDIDMVATLKNSVDLKSNRVYKHD